MKPEEQSFFESFMTVHPEFLDAKSWIPGPEPPDVILTDIHDRKLGIELTEWLDERQTTPSISDQENQMEWLVGARQLPVTVALTMGWPGVPLLWILTGQVTKE